MVRTAEVAVATATGYALLRGANLSFFVRPPARRITSQFGLSCLQIWAQRRRLLAEIGPNVFERLSIARPDEVKSRRPTIVRLAPPPLPSPFRLVVSPTSCAHLRPWLRPFLWRFVAPLKKATARCSLSAAADGS
uniref:Secreted protein n=1 Tax=Plectus sambesii TaxID=2011161 RepID=A0A914URF0_9BILA